MYGLALVVSMLASHDPYHWEMSCWDWNEVRAEVLRDQNYTPDAKEYLIDYFHTKVPDKNCEAWQLGRK